MKPLLFFFYLFICVLFSVLIVSALQLANYNDKKRRIELAIENNIFCPLNTTNTDCVLQSNLELTIPSNTIEYSSEIALFGCNLIACLDLAFIDHAQKQGINIPNGVDIVKHILYKDTTIGLICRTNINTIWIVFRGTQTMQEWKKDLLIQQISSSKFEGLIHEGFLQVYRSIHNDVHNTLTEIGTIDFLYICGQSLGGALSLLLIADPLTNQNNKACYLFGTPRIGNPDFANSLTDLNIYRIVNRADIICDLPTSVSPNFVGDPNDVFLYQHPTNSEIVFFEDNRSSIIENHSLKTYLQFLAS